MTKEIQLTRGVVALVDDADFAWLNSFHWAAHTNSQGQWYAQRSSLKSEGRPRRMIQMHRFILTPHSSIEVDHQNGNGLDNRRENLRPATKSQNQVNTGKRRNNSSGFKGVYRKSNSRWCAEMNFQGRKIHIGYFSEPEEAAKAYDKAARERHGEFAYQNFPTEGAQ